jgi:hypothetical protein
MYHDVAVFTFSIQQPANGGPNMDLMEILGYFLGFWLFVFNRKFRKMVTENWESSSVAGKLFIIVGAISSFICGVLVPLWILNNIQNS